MAPAPATAAAVAALALAIWSSAALPALAQANVGCLFSARVCDESTEWCYDDYAFGRCLPQHGPIDNDAFYRFDLLRPALHALQREMERLFRQGYRWSHAYTQCVLQALLADVRSGLGQFERALCDPLADQDLEAALKAIEGDEQEQLDQRNLARVAFTPSASDPHPEFADEVYFPPLGDEDLDVNVVEVEQGAGPRGYYAPPVAAGVVAAAPPAPAGPAPGPVKRSARHRRRLAMAEPQLFAAHYNTPDGFRHGQETRDLRPPPPLVTPRRAAAPPY
ncbi:hypothetical protein R5R35_008698 [Gryllus longicercus]|uniref:Uncharacterized protein n=1 Tax=Gryllus longicercus TaxID=2509291 RepID=A0AAN9VH65_9ORTH